MEILVGILSAGRSRELSATKAELDAAALVLEKRESWV